MFANADKSPVLMKTAQISYGEFVGINEAANSSAKAWYKDNTNEIAISAMNSGNATLYTIGGQLKSSITIMVAANATKPKKAPTAQANTVNTKPLIVIIILSPSWQVFKQDELGTVQQLTLVFQKIGQCIAIIRAIADHLLCI
jgi:hypothetical protein